MQTKLMSRKRKKKTDQSWQVVTDESWNQDTQNNPEFYMLQQFFEPFNINHCPNIANVLIQVINDYIGGWLGTRDQVLNILDRTQEDVWKCCSLTIDVVKLIYKLTDKIPFRYHNDIFDIVISFINKQASFDNNQYNYTLTRFGDPCYLSLPKCLYEKIMCDVCKPYHRSSIPILTVIFRTMSRLYGCRNNSEQLVVDDLCETLMFLENEEYIKINLAEMSILYIA